MPLGEDIDALMEPLIAQFSGQMLELIEGEITAIYVSGTAQMTRWAGVPFEGPPIDQAVSFARKRGAQMVTRMDDVTRQRLARTISQGIKSKRGIPGLARDIRKTFDDMSKFRSELVAHTETANALGEAFIVRGKELGIAGKEWITQGDERVSADCLENEAAGVIPIDQSFPTGVMHVPQHPACRCANAPVRAGARA